MHGAQLSMTPNTMQTKINMKHVHVKLNMFIVDIDPC